MFKIDRHKEWLGQFVKFGLIGVLNTIIDVAVFALLIVLSVHYAAAQTIAYLAGMANSYYMNSVFTFRSRKGAAAPGKDPGRKWRFIVWNTAMLALSIALIALATDGFGVHEMISKIVVTLPVVALNFYGSKRWVFAEKKRKVDEAGTGEVV